MIFFLGSCNFSGGKYYELVEWLHLDACRNVGHVLHTFGELLVLVGDMKLQVKLNVFFNFCGEKPVHEFHRFVGRRFMQEAREVY